MFCENCGAKNEDDALFCLTCGAKLEGGKKEGAEGSAPSDTNNAEGADAQQSADNVVPAANVEFDPETGEAITNDKKKPPITKIVGGVVGAVVVVGVVVGGVNLVKGVFTKSSSTYYKHAIIYMKDKEDLMVRKNGKKESYKIDDYDEYETPTIQVTDDGKTMFILNEEDNKLYYRSVNSTKPKKNESSEGTLISKNVNYFSISDDGKFVIYDKDGKLCYNNLKEEQVIAKKYSDIYGVSKDKKKILFKNDDGDVELATLGKKITSEVVIKDKDLEAGDNGVSFVKYSENFDEFLYVGKDKLYYKSGSKDAEQIAKDVVAANMLDGTIYYVVDETETKTYGDYINDDCKSSDDKISAPSGNRYSSSYSSAWDKYYDKTARDDIRNNYFDDELTVSKYKLCSYSGGKETVVDEQASSNFYINNVNGTQGATYSAKFPEITGGVLMYTKSDSEPSTVKLSDYNNENMYQIKDNIRYSSNDDDDKSDVYAVCGGVSYEVDDIEYAEDFTVIGNKVYAIVDSERDEDTYQDFGDLVSFDIGKGLTNKETVAEDVATDGFNYSNSDDDKDRKDPVYIVKGKDELGMLKNGKYTTIDSDAEYGEYTNVTYKDGAVYYLADYNSSKHYGDLVYYKNGKSETIGSDVNQYIPRGKDVVVYISEYDYNDGTGDLCKRKGKGKEVVIDDEVSSILY
jgi:hypothetical protein